MLPTTCGVLMTVGLFICCFSLACGIYIAYKGISSLYHHQSKDMNVFFKILFLCSISTYLLCIVSFTFALSLLCYDKPLYDTLSRIAAFIYTCMILPLLLVTFTARLHCTFQHTIYKLNPNILRLICCTIAFITICNAGYVAISLDYYTFSRNESLYRTALRMFLISVVFYLILSCAVVAIFIKKLKQLITAHNSYEKLPLRKNSIRSIRISHHQLRLIALVSKYLIIAGFAFTSTFIAVLSIIFLQSTYDTVLVAPSIIRFLAIIDAAINMICLYLQFDFALNDYKYLCSSCDKLCKNRLKNKAEKKLSVNLSNMECVIANSVHVVVPSNSTQMSSLTTSSISSSLK